MIRVEYKDPVIGLAIHDLATSTFYSFPVTKKYGIQILSSHMLASIILPWLSPLITQFGQWTIISINVNDETSTKENFCLISFINT